jgi:hypothetical protein
MPYTLALLQFIITTVKVLFMMSRGNFQDRFLSEAEDSS